MAFSIADTFLINQQYTVPRLIRFQVIHFAFSTAVTDPDYTVNESYLVSTSATNRDAVSTTIS